MTTLQPLSQSNRDRSLDILRGFALTGVLFVFCVSDIDAAKDYINSFWDDFIDWPKWVLIEGRMYGMLILIFGMGFGVQVNKAIQKRESLVPVFLRRLTGLLIIGFIHAILISNRDILIFYALAGFALLPARNFSNRQLMWFMIIVFALLVTPFIKMITGNPWKNAGNLTEPNNFRDHLDFNWRYFKAYHQLYSIYVDMLFHFLLGFYLYRAGFLEVLKANKKFRKRLLITTLTVFIILGPLYYTWVDPVLWPAISELKDSLQKFLLTTFANIYWQTWIMCCVLLYISILISLSSKDRYKNWFKPLAAFGQMALSNYIMQSLILVPYALWFNKFNDTPPFSGLILFLVVFAFQLFFSVWWLKKYKLGPFEWLLRSFT
jgi:uncharacterized protein